LKCKGLQARVQDPGAITRGGNGAMAYNGVLNGVMVEVRCGGVMVESNGSLMDL
jgi:hypothetical protein